jgi:hypothetical protein
MSPPTLKVLLACLLVESLLFATFAAVTHSALSALVCSVAVGGPASVWLAPMLWRRWRSA